MTKKDKRKKDPHLEYRGNKIILDDRDISIEFAKKEYEKRKKAKK